MTKENDKYFEIKIYEKYMSFNINDELIFIDSFQFVSQFD